MKRAKSLIDSYQMDQRDLDGIKGLEALSRAQPYKERSGATDESPESLSKARQHFETELKGSVEILERKKNPRHGGSSLPWSLSKRSYGLVNRVKEDKWKCIDGAVFPTSHQAYSHIRSLKERRKQQQGDELLPEELTPPLKRRKKDLEQHDRMSAHIRFIHGAEVDFNQMRPTPQVYLLARHWFSAAVEGVNSVVTHQHQAKEGGTWQNKTLTSPLPSPDKRKTQPHQQQEAIPPRKVSEVLVNSLPNQSATELLSDHKARWALARKHLH